jgi:hypothetical protein
MYLASVSRIPFTFDFEIRSELRNYKLIIDLENNR